MTDRELLEAAAKAAGLKPPMPMHGPGLTWGHGWWNPLVDSGEALELAVKLHLPVEAMIAFVAEREPDWVEDPLAATRRAIVRAAAEIGRSKE